MQFINIKNSYNITYKAYTSAPTKLEVINKFLNNKLKYN